jgi:hypothetical protein
MTAEITKWRAARLSEKEQPGCPDRADCDHQQIVADKVGINHQSDAEEHWLPQVHSLSVNEGDEADRAKDKTADQICRAQIQHGDKRAICGPISNLWLTAPVRQ